MTYNLSDLWLRIRRKRARKWWPSSSQARGITDARVLDAMRTVERDRFIPSELREHAYDDGPLPIGSDQTISQPYMVALSCEVAQLTGVERVLEIGTGSGYEAAVLSKLAAQVVTIESHPSSI